MMEFSVLKRTTEPNLSLKNLIKGKTTDLVVEIEFREKKFILCSKSTKTSIKSSSVGNTSEQGFAK